MSALPTHSPMIAGPGLVEGSEVHAQLNARVQTVENWAGTLQKSIERVELEARAGQARLEGKLDDQTALLGAKIDSLATRHLAGQRTNWGVIASWVGVGVGIVLAIGSGYLKPAEIIAAEHGRRLEKVEERERADFERSVRNEERINALRENAAAKRGTP